VSGYERIERLQNIAVGIFVIIGVFALGWLIFKFNDLPTTVSKINSYEVVVQFASAPGTQKDTPVRFCGYQIGRVTDIKPPEIRDELKDGRKTGRRFYQSLVILNIDKQYKNIPANVKVKLMTRGLGSSYIELVYEPNKPLVPLDANRPEESKYLEDGILLQGQEGTSSEFFPEESQNKHDELIGSLITKMNNTNENIGDPNSTLNWTVDTHPAWGTWSFTPMSGENLTPEEGTTTVQVYVTAPDQKNTEFQGYIRVINTDNPNDFNLIPVYLTTPLIDITVQPVSPLILSQQPLFLFKTLHQVLK
jgi:hypothetical protein